MGETEKNLEALLKESKEADVVLFLDEVWFLIITSCVLTHAKQRFPSRRPYATPLFNPSYP